jgi:hypothetical protein
MQRWRVGILLLLTARSVGGVRGQHMAESRHCAAMLVRFDTIETRDLIPGRGSGYNVGRQVQLNK